MPDNPASARPEIESPIKAVIFDFGNVLCFPPAEEKILRAAADCKLTRDQFWDAFWAPRLDYDAGKIEPDDYWQTVLSAAGKEFDPAQFPALIRHEVEFWNHFDLRMLDWVDQLRTAGIRTAMLSNLPRVLGEELRTRNGFYDRFDHLTLSYELRTIKPDPAIYQHAIDGLQIDPQDALFLDDKQPNIDGALAVGLKAELFTSFENFLDKETAFRFSLPTPFNRLA